MFEAASISKYGIGFVVGVVLSLGLYAASLDTKQEPPKVHQRIATEREPTKSIAESSPLRQVSFYSNLYNEAVIDEAKEEAFVGPVLFNEHVAYSGYFAETYGYPTKYVSDELPASIDLMAFEVKYAGAFQRCNIKMLVDKDGPVDLVSFPVLKPFAGSALNMMDVALPRRIKGFQVSSGQQNYRSTQHEYLSSQQLRDYVHNSFSLSGDGPGRASVTLLVDVLKPDLFAEWSFLSLRAGCSELIGNIVSKQDVWMNMRFNGEASGNDTSLQIVDNMIQVKVPQKVLVPLRNDLAKIALRQ